MKGHINQLYPDIQAGSQPGHLAYCQLKANERQRLARLQNLTDARIRAIEGQRSGQRGPGHVGKRQSVHLHHTQVHYGTFIANSKDTLSCGKKGRQCI